MIFQIYLIFILVYVFIGVMAITPYEDLYIQSFASFIKAYLAWLFWTIFSYSNICRGRLPSHHLQYAYNKTKQA